MAFLRPLNFVTLCLFVCCSNGQDKLILNKVVDPKLIRADLRPIYLNPQIGGRSGNPGFQIRISSKGLSYANTVAGRLLNAEIRTPPTYSYAANPPNQLSWRTSGGKISVKGNWKAKKKIWFATIRKSGSFSASASNIRIAVSAEFSNSNGKPQLTKVRCSAQIGNLSLKIKGGILGWIVNLFRRKIARKIKPPLEKAICKEATKFVQNDANAKLRTFPMNTRVGRSFQLDYSLISDPRMSNGGIASYHKGEIRYRHSRKQLQFYPHNMHTGSSPKMVYFYGSDYILNSFFSHAHKNRISVYTINDKTLPKVAKYLRTTCAGLCLGTVFPEIGQSYPNSKGSMRFETTGEPTALFSTGRATLRALGKITLDVQQRSSFVQILTANVSVSVDLKPRVSSDFRRVTGTAEINRLDISGVQTSAGLEKLGANELQELADLVTPILEMQADEYLKEGLVIPVTKGVRLRNVTLRLLRRTAELSADVTYTG